MDHKALDGLLRPSKIAVVGASATPGKIGYTVLKNLLEGGYKGKIYPVNPSATEILGLKVYPTISDIPENIDAAIITIPAKAVISTIDELGAKGAKGMIVITSGFSEVGLKDLERELVEKANSYGIRVLGPNIVGVL
ncbi:MAG TPA: CoA-binding protein, partial [Anaerolineaceae bacterium]|nr:CoA-binding protein [Anaerolineaceae bacterium]